MVDVITKVADGIATSGRWNSNDGLFIFILIWVQRCLTEPNPICVAFGICLYFFLGIDC